MHLSTMSEWLNYLGSVHRRNMELGLTRVKQVAERLNLLSCEIPIITVGGTNGKGSTVAGLKAIYRATTLHVGTFTSPYLVKHNEEVEINGAFASDDAFCQAFSTIESARREITLTPFEFHTLAALLIFRDHPLDVIVLEVGLGGRLDAVNIMDPDLAIITSIDLDHMDWLGDTREKIAQEKAGIFRADVPAVCGDFNPPHTLCARAKALCAPLFCQGRDFHFDEDKKNGTWSFSNSLIQYDNLPINRLATQNMATVLQGISLLQHKLPVSDAMIRKGLSRLSLPGRMQIIEERPKVILDVAHNKAACTRLAKCLAELNIKGKVHAVFSMLADKDIQSCIAVMRDIVDDWHIAALSDKRAASLTQLVQAFNHNQIHTVKSYETIVEAFEQAKEGACDGNIVLVFGSFYTVGKILPLVDSNFA